MKKIFTLCLLFSLFACDKEELNTNTSTPVTNVNEQNPYDHCNGPCDNQYESEHNFVYYENGQRWLRGGNERSMDFNISNWTLEERGLRYGLGRESFKALVNPHFIQKEDYPRNIQPDEMMIVLHGENTLKVYPLDLMNVHEVINDEIDGQAIAVTYCPLADFINVYKRDYCGAVLTFALSGYTHNREGIHNGKDGFILWDRNTESLWWPLIHKGVSGEMLDQTMTPYHPAKWEVTTYGQISQSSPDFVLLKPGQDIDFEGEWTETLSQEVNCD